MPDALTGLLIQSAAAPCRGIISPEQWAVAAHEAGYRALGLADWIGLHGALEFLAATERVGIAGALGTLIPVRMPAGEVSQLFVFCMNSTGYRTLAQAVSVLRGAFEEPDVPLVSDARPPALRSLKRALRNGGQGLLLLCDHPGLLTRLPKLVPGAQVAARLPWPPEPAVGATALAEAAERTRAPLAALPLATHLSTSERESLILLAAIRRGELLGSSAHPYMAGMPGAEERAHWEMRAHTVVAAGGALLAGCELRAADLESRGFIFPGIGGREGAVLLRARCRAGLRGRGVLASRRARERLDHELGVIEELGFVDYFLAVTRIVDWARAEGIAIVGRGSGVASLVAYLLRITNVDPIRYNLCFERFLHEYREDCPDIDLDIAWDRHDEVIDYALHAFGVNRAVQIGTHQHFHLRGAFREVGRAMGLGDEAINRVRHDLKGLSRDSDRALRRAAQAAERLAGLLRGISVHACGIVLSDRPMSQIVPLERLSTGAVVTQLDMHGVEKLGLVKIDLLGNRVLGTITEVTRGLAARGRGIDLSRIPHDDRGVTALLAEGRTLGCFQTESPAMRSLLRQVQPADLDGLIASLALIRPGPASSGMKEAFIERSRGIAPGEAADPAFEALLCATHGVPLYEEDVIRIAAAVTGISLAEADMLRRSVGKAVKAQEDPERGEEVVRLREGFIRAASEKVGPRTAERAWDEMVRFCAYAFCKAHAAGFGQLAYESAYLKAHHPGAFFTAILNNARGMYPLRVYADEARRWGVRLKGPCIHASGRTWRWESGPGLGGIRIGLARIAHLHTATLERLLAERDRRPFQDLGDVLQRLRPSAPELEALLSSGAFDEAFGEPRGRLVWQMRRLLRRPRPTESISGQESLGLRIAARRHAGGPWRDISPRQRARLERRFLGISLALHPTQLGPPGAPEGTLPIAEALTWVNRRVRLWGIVSAARGHVGQNGLPMLFVTLEDPTGMAEGIIRGRATLERIGRLSVDDLVRVEGTVRDQYGAPSIQIDGARVLARH